MANRLSAESKPVRGSVSFNGILLVLALAMNVFLGMQIHSIKKTLAHADDVSTAEKIGMILAPIVASDLNGKKVNIDFTDKSLSTIVYIMRPSCSWCARNLANVRKLAASVDGRFRVIGLAVDDPSLKSYVEAASMGFPVYSIASYEVIPNVQLGATPQTLVVEPGGKVVKNWLGAFDQSQLGEVEEFFHTTLPGLSTN